MSFKSRIFISCLVLFLCSVSLNAMAEGGLAQELMAIEGQSEREVKEVLAVSEAFARITGTAVSPALGLGLLGVYDHIQGEEHWYVTPFIYVPLLLLVALEFVKNTFGMAVFPGPLRKPLDGAFQLVGYLNANLGLVMSMGIAYEAFQPQVLVALNMLSESLVSSAYASEGLPVAAVGTSFVGFLAALCGAFIYFSIWLISHTFELMVFLCPFSSIDVILKSTQQIFTGVVLLLSILFPPLAVIICAIYFLFCLLMFGYCLRFSIFGTTMLWHFLFQRGKGQVDLTEGLPCFAAKLKGVKNNTRGLLIHQDGQYRFQYKEKFIFERSVPVDLSTLYLIESFNYPSLNTKENGWGKTQLVFSPQFQNQEEQLAKELNVPLGAGLILSGYKGAVSFIKNRFLNRDVEVPHTV